MYATVVIVLLALKSTNAVQGDCCAPSYTADGFNGMQQKNIKSYYDAETGRGLEEAVDGAYTIFSDPTTGRLYMRFEGTVCVYTENPGLQGSKICITESNQAASETVTLDGEELNKWTQDDQSFWYYNAECVVVKKGDALRLSNVETGSTDLAKFDAFETSDCGPAAAIFGR